MSDALFMTHELMNKRILGLFTDWEQSPDSQKIAIEKDLLSAIKMRREIAELS